MSPYSADLPLHPTRICRLALLRWVVAGLVTVGFVVAYGLDPLYSSNQNERFLHPLAQGGLGYLSNDWVANTPDPFPVFSQIVEWTYRYGDPKLFYTYQAVVIALYFVALIGIANACTPLRGSYWFPLFIALLFLVHSSAVERITGDLLGVNVLSSLHRGFASQYVLGRYFQPSVVGVLLILSIWAYLRHRIVLATFLAAATPAIHPTYLLPAFALTAVYVVTVIRQDRDIRRGVVLAVVAAIIVLPSAAFAVIRFTAASPELQAEARRILVEVRQPQHAVPVDWFGWDDIARVALIAAALIVVRQTRLFAVLAVLTAVGTALTAIQILSGSNSLALVFPWRISVVLVPIASAVLIAAGVSRLPRTGLDPRAATSRGRLLAFGLAATVTGLTVIGGAVEIERNFAMASRRDYLGVARFLKEESATPATALIPPNGLDGFRLESGLPIVVDWKSIPWSAPEVVEWYRRYQEVSTLYEERFDCERIRATASNYEVTWVVWPTDPTGNREPVNCPNLVSVYDDRSYVVLRVPDGDLVPETSRTKAPNQKSGAMSLE